MNAAMRQHLCSSSSISSRALHARQEYVAAVENVFILGRAIEERDMRRALVPSSQKKQASGEEARFGSDTETTEPRFPSARKTPRLVPYDNGYETPDTFLDDRGDVVSLRDQRGPKIGKTMPSRPKPAPAHEIVDTPSNPRAVVTVSDGVGAIMDWWEADLSDVALPRPGMCRSPECEERAQAGGSYCAGHHALFYARPASLRAARRRSRAARNRE